MSATQIAELLANALYTDEDAYRELTSCRTFEEAGVLSREAGLVVTLQDGSEFQLTVVRSR